MIDGIIAGTGNSRLVKSVPNFLQLYPTYEAFVGALIAGTLPLDIIFNSPGWQQLPDFLNKANLLKDETAALYSLQNTAVPDDVFSVIKTLITTAQETANSKAILTTGSYVGTGTSGSSGKNSLSFDFVPKLLFISCEPVGRFLYPYYSYFTFGDTNVGAGSYMNGLSFSLQESTNNGVEIKYGFDGNNVYWYSDEASRQLNYSGNTYYYVAVGNEV